MEVSKTKYLGQSRIFFISKTRQVFIQLTQIFVEALILNAFNLKHYIYIETNTFGYVISEIF